MGNGAAQETREQRAQRGAPVGGRPEELEEPVIFPDSTGSYLVVMDPLDGSSNIDVDISIGTSGGFETVLV